jgi:hypothetical protein
VSEYHSVLTAQFSEIAYTAYEVHILMRDRFCHSLDQTPEGRKYPVFGFPKDSIGYYFPSRHLKAALRAWAFGGGFSEKYKSQQFSAKLKGPTAIRPERIYICHWDGSTEPRLWTQRMEVQTRMGRRKVVRDLLYFDRPYLRFVIWHHRQDGHLGLLQFKELFAYGEHAGLGSERTQGAGEFVTLFFQARKKPPNYPMQKPVIDVPFIDIPADDP